MINDKTYTAMPKRFIWAVDMLDLQPWHRVLEIGCGVGLMAEVICNKLQDGKLVAIDKSSFMIEKAKLRNKSFIAGGVASFVTADFLKADLQRSTFDVITAFNLNFFRKDPAKVLQRVKQFLKPGGKLFIFFQDPYEITISAADLIAEKLSAHGFTVLDTKLKELSPTSAICVVAVPV
ncbi:class I SAM-dependent methyltransferase [Lacibacter sp. H375]|uniref:class I SAM-dependent methyltransferase n=1 Tax=Lacibacter sp. H375 TaxID=3133424 RepID=UPI0030C64821